MLGLGHFCVFMFHTCIRLFCKGWTVGSIVVKVKLTVPLLCISVCAFCLKGHPWNDLYRVRCNVKHYSLTFTPIRI